MESVQLNAIGVNIIATVVEDGVVVDISSASTTELIFRKPNATTITQTAAFVTDGTDGKIQYVSETDFFNVLGIWSAQAYVILPTGFNGRSDVMKFEVRKNL